MSTFTPLEIDINPSSALSPTPTPAPVYIYGASGRCWKFNNPSSINTYFTNLCSESVHELYNWLLNKYGSTIFERLRMIYKKYPEITPYEFGVVVTNSDGSVKLLNPTKWKHHYKNANITFYLNHKIYESYTYLDILCTDFFSQEKYKNSCCEKVFPYTHCRTNSERYHIEYRNNLYCGVLNMNSEFLDYWNGDRIRYTEPRTTPPTELPTAPPVVDTPCYPFLRFRRNRIRTQEFTPMMIEID